MTAADRPHLVVATLHAGRLPLVAGLERSGVFAPALRPGDRTAGSPGIDLVPPGFAPPPDVAPPERWTSPPRCSPSTRPVRRAEEFPWS